MIKLSSLATLLFQSLSFCAKFPWERQQEPLSSICCSVDDVLLFRSKSSVFNHQLTEFKTQLQIDYIWFAISAKTFNDTYFMCTQQVDRFILFQWYENKFKELHVSSPNGSPNLLRKF